MTYTAWEMAIKQLSGCRNCWMLPAFNFCVYKRQFWMHCNLMQIVIRVQHVRFIQIVDKTILLYLSTKSVPPACDWSKSRHLVITNMHRRPLLQATVTAGDNACGCHWGCCGRQWGVT